MIQPTENPLFFGIDRLELYTEGIIAPEIYTKLEELSEKAKESEQDIECSELGCVVLHKAYGRFPVALRWKQVLLRVGAFRAKKQLVKPASLQLGSTTKRENLPGENVTHRAKMDCYSEFCNQRNLHQLQRDTREVFETLFERLPTDIKISRVDIAKDTTYKFKRSDKKRLVTQSRKIAEFTQEKINRVDSALYHVGSTFTGFVIGAGDKRLRIYNKTEEILAKHKTTRYSEIYLNRKQPIWRIEFQLRRGKNWDLYHHNFCTAIPYLWRQLTSFTRFCKPSKDKQKDRWKTAKFWSMIQDANALGKGYKPKTKKLEISETRQLYAQAWGVLQKAAALENIESREEIITKMIETMKKEKEWKQGLQVKRLETLQSDKIHKTTPLQLRNLLLETEFH